MEENLEDLLLSPHLVKRRTSVMLSIKNLTKTYKGGKKAVSNLKPGITINLYPAS